MKQPYVIVKMARLDGTIELILQVSMLNQRNYQTVSAGDTIMMMMMKGVHTHTFRSYASFFFSRGVQVTGIWSSSWNACGIAKSGFAIARNNEPQGLP